MPFDLFLKHFFYSTHKKNERSKRSELCLLKNLKRSKRSELDLFQKYERSKRKKKLDCPKFCGIEGKRTEFVQKAIYTRIRRIWIYSTSKNTWIKLRNPNPQQSELNKPYQRQTNDIKSNLTSLEDLILTNCFCPLLLKFTRWLSMATLQMEDPHTWLCDQVW